MVTKQIRGPSKPTEAINQSRQEQQLTALKSRPQHDARTAPEDLAGKILIDGEIYSVAEGDLLLDNDEVDIYHSMFKFFSGPLNSVFIL
jgi:hypothetical protein